MRNIYLFVVLLLSMISCNEADLMQYSDIPRVYLGGYTRAASQTFFYDAEDVVRDTIYVYVETMGGPRDYDRLVSFRQMTVYDVEYVVENGVNVDSTVTENPYNAVADKHFVAFDSEEAKKLMVVPANEVSANIPIILLRDPSPGFEPQRDHQRKEGRGLPFFVCIQLLSDDLRRLDSNTLVFDTPSTALRHDRSAKAGYAPLSACPVIGIRNRAVRTADG